MTTQTKFMSRPYAGETDLQPICDLLNYCTDVDKLEDPYFTVEDFGHRLDEPGIEKERDIRLWHDADSRLVGYGQIWKNKPDDGTEKVDAFLAMHIHPDVRNQGLETEMIEWGAERAQEIARERNQPVHLRAGFEYSTPEYIAYREKVLDEHGFKPVRYWFKMARPLNEPIPEPVFPEGFTMRHSDGDTDVAPWVEMFNLSFIDHWNHHDATVEEMKHWLSSPKYNKERDLIAIAPDGTFAAFCFCWIDPEDNEHNNRKEGWIDILGTRRGFRKIGLGRAMLLAGMHRLKAEGMDTAVLGVDAENPTGALRLYESVGFTPVQKGVTYHKDL